MTTFVLRLEVDDIGEVTGIVERVRSGEKQRFHGYAMLGEVIRCMVASDREVVPYPRRAERVRCPSQRCLRSVQKEE
jgi:hypothetical protein